MNTKRIVFWIGFLIVLALIVWGLAVAMNKPAPGTVLGTPASVTSTDHVRGSDNAPITLIEYSDFQCPACRAYYPVIEKLFTEASTTMRFVYRHYPLYPQPHKNAMVAAQAAEAAGKQGKFWEMYGILFENQTTWENSNDAKTVFEGYAGQLALNMPAYRTDFDDPAIKAKIDGDHADGVKIGVRGTPTFFINGVSITNPQNYEQFKALIDAAASGGSN